MSLFSWLQPSAVSEAQVRAEVWKLGSRHLGWPLEGALKELQDPAISGERAQLLRACVRKLRATKTG